VFLSEWSCHWIETATLFIPKNKKASHCCKAFCGLNGATIEPLIPLLTFIGNIDFDQSFKNKVSSINANNEKARVKLIQKRKKGPHL